MNAWYITTGNGFATAMGPNDPDDEAIAMIFLSEASANKWIEDNDASGFARIIPCQVVDGHEPVYTPSTYPLLPIF